MNVRFHTALLAAAASTASADLQTLTGAGGPINDNTTNRFTIFVPDHGPATVDSFAISMAHTWSGDLLIDVRHAPSNYSVIFIANVTDISSPDDFNGWYLFREGFSRIPVDATGTGIVPPGTYGPWTAGTLARTVPDRFGEWTLTIRDTALGDVGAVHEWRMTLDHMPAPSSAALLGVGAFVLQRGRR